MAWETIKRGSMGKIAYGMEWYKEPRIAVNKTGVTFNRQAVAAFSLKPGERVCVMIDRAACKIAFKSALTQEEEEHGFTLQSNDKSKDYPTALHVCVRKIVKAFPECHGKDFSIKLNRGQLLMEADLLVQG